MSEPWDAELFRVPDVSWQTQAPPARHPIPAGYVRDLEVGDELTIGLPGQYFLDGQLLALADRSVTTLPGGSEQLEALAVAAPYAFWVARAFAGVQLTMHWWPVAFTWVYRDAVRPGEPYPGGPDDPGARGLRGGRADPDAQPRSWLDHVRPTLREPPVRQARPAREAASMTGRTVRLQHERGAWSWWVAVSEPIDQDGDFVVHVMKPTDYWLAQAAAAPPEQVRVVPLFRLHLYD
jgi:hypothetical protein